MRCCFTIVAYETVLPRFLSADGWEMGYCEIPEQHLNPYNLNLLEATHGESKLQYANIFHDYFCCNSTYDYAMPV